MQTGPYNYFVAAAGLRNFRDLTAGLYATAVWSAVRSALRARGRSISPDNTARLSANDLALSFGGSFTPEVDGFLRLSWSGLRFLLAARVPDPEWCRFCGLRHPCHSLRSFSARQSNHREESISRPADYAPCANLDGEEVCPVSLRFQVHRHICILICFERVAILKSVLPRYRQLHHNDGIRRRRHEHQVRPLATFYQHLGIVPHPF